MVRSVTFGYAAAGRTAITSASLLAWIRQTNELQVLQRRQPPGSPGFNNPSGSGDGCRPSSRMRVASRAIPGACGTAGNGYGLRGGSVGSSPTAPRTWYSCSARS